MFFFNRFNPPAFSGSILIITLDVKRRNYAYKVPEILQGFTRNKPFKFQFYFRPFYSPSAADKIGMGERELGIFAQQNWTQGRVFIVFLRFKTVPWYALSDKVWLRNSYKWFLIWILKIETIKTLSEKETAEKFVRT